MPYAERSVRAPTSGYDGPLGLEAPGDESEVPAGSNTLRVRPKWRMARGSTLLSPGPRKGPFASLTTTRITFGNAWTADDRSSVAQRKSSRLLNGRSRVRITPEPLAIRIRKDGSIVCAAMHPPEDGDTYMHDGLHYKLSAELGALVTEPMEPDPARPGLGGHGKHGEWWWRDSVPPDAVIEDFTAR